ncbi:MAG: hypothetical protein HDS10_00115 [Bacteroides sp.]|nr:hypothetical protein [Bacteroides sp.]
MKQSLYYYLEPYVYFSVAKNGVLLVNLLDDQLLFFNDLDSIKIVRGIISSNLRVVEINYDDLKTPLIRSTIKSFMGDIIESDSIPLQFDSEINNISGIEAYRKSIKFTRYGIGSLISDCYIITDLKNTSSHRLIQLLSGIEIPQESQHSSVVITEIGLKEIITKISASSPYVRFFISELKQEVFKHLLENSHNSENIIPVYSFETLQEDTGLCRVLVDNNLRSKIIIHTSNSLEDLRINKGITTIMLGIQSVEDVKKYNSLIENGYFVEAHPVLTNNNIPFIKSLFSWSLDDFKRLGGKYQTIKQNNLVNSNNWGRIFVNPNGEISYSPLELSRGMHSLDNLFESFQRILLKGNFAWTRIRDYSQCKNCCFQRLCPSPSLIEDYLRSNYKWECNCGKD